MASKSVGLLTIAFGANTKGFDKAIKKAQRKMKKFGAGLKKVGKGMSVGLTAPLVAFAAVSIKAFDVQAKAEASLLTALKGRSDVQQRLIKQAQDLQKTTLFGDEETIAAQTMLATMGLSEEAILRLTPAIQDMAVAKRMGLVQAADLVAKSVGSSTNALSRYGITITGAVGSTERLDTAVGALTDQFQGQAETAAGVGAGALVQLQNQLGDISEEIGGMLMPTVLKIVTKIKDLAERFKNLSISQKENVIKWAAIFAAIGPVLLILGQLTIVLSAMIPVLAKTGKGWKKLTTFMKANPWILVATAVALVTTALISAHKQSKRLADTQIGVRNAIASANESVVEQKLSINGLVKEFNKENATLEDKEKVLKRLQLIAPEYYGHLTAAKITTRELNTATKKYIDTLLLKAKVQAAEQEIIRLSKEELKLQKLKGEAAKSQEKTYQNLSTSTHANTTAGVYWNAIISTQIGLHSNAAKKTQGYNKELAHTKENISSLATFIDKIKKENISLFEPEEEMVLPEFTGRGDGGAAEAAALKKKEDAQIASDVKLLAQHKLDLKTRQEITDEANQTDMDKAIAAVEEKYGALIQRLDVFGIDVTELTRLKEEELATIKKDGLAEVTDFLKTEDEKEIEAIEEKYANMIALAEKYNLDVLALEKKKQEEIDAVKEQEKTTYDLVQDKLADTLIQGAASLDEYVTNVKNAVREVIIAKIAEAISGALASAFTSLPFPFNLAAAPIAMLAAKALANKFLPSFAEGGIVSSPMMAMVGDSPHGPEVIAPIDKLKAMMGNNTQNIVVTGRLSGTDIFLSNRKTADNRKRGV